MNATVTIWVRQDKTMEFFKWQKLFEEEPQHYIANEIDSGISKHVSFCEKHAYIQVNICVVSFTCWGYQKGIKLI